MDTIDSKIEGLLITKLVQFKDERGAVMKFLDRTKFQFIDFGEVYFSLIKPGAIKGWKLHKVAVQNICAVYGETTFAFLDLRENSPTLNKSQEIVIDTEDRHYLITIPPGVWYAFKSSSSEFSIISNVSSIVHNPVESVTSNFKDGLIEYEWEND